MEAWIFAVESGGGVIRRSEGREDGEIGICMCRAGDRKGVRA